MTLLYATGFDLYTTLADVTTFEGWSQVTTGNGTGASISLQTTNGRFGGACLALNNGASNGSIFARRGMNATLGAAGAHTFAGCAFRPTNSGTIISLLDSGTTQVDVRFSSTDNSISITRNGTTLVTSGGGVISLNTYHYVEVDTVIASGTSGSVTVRVDLKTALTVTGVSTQATGNASWNQLQFGTAPASDNRYDDVYVCDANGSQNNTFLGDVRMITELPSGAGTHSGFTQVGGSGGGNFTSVNEKPNDADTSYVAASTVGTIDTYLYPALSTATASVFAVIAKPMARKDDAGNRHFTTLYRTAGGSEATFAATDITLTSSYAESAQIQETNPVTASAWLPSDISTGEFGPKISA